LRVGIAPRHQRERLIELGIDAGGAQQSLHGLGVVGLQLGIFQIAACAGAARFYGRREMAAGVVVAMARERQQSEPFLSFRHLDAVADQALVLGCGLAPRQQVRACQARIGIGDRFFREIALRHGPAGKHSGREVPFGEMALGLRLHLGRDLPNALRYAGSWSTPLRRL